MNHYVLDMDENGDAFYAIACLPDQHDLGNPQYVVFIGVETASVEADLNAGNAVVHNSRDEAETALAYYFNRRSQYPSVEAQLDKIFNDGIDAWKADIQAIKNANPKP